MCARARPCRGGSSRWRAPVESLVSRRDCGRPLSSLIGGGWSQRRLPAQALRVPCSVRERQRRVHPVPTKGFEVGLKIQTSRPRGPPWGCSGRNGAQTEIVGSGEWELPVHASSHRKLDSEVRGVCGAVRARLCACVRACVQNACVYHILKPARHSEQDKKRCCGQG